jgi:hypothetical protein
MVGMVLVEYLGLVVWFMVCNRCEACVHGSWFGYRWDACEFYWFGYRWDACELCCFWLQVGCMSTLVSLATGVTPVSSRALITVGKLGAWSCLDVIKSRCFSLQLNLLLSLSCYNPTYHYFSTLTE